MEKDTENLLFLGAFQNEEREDDCESVLFLSDSVVDGGIVGRRGYALFVSVRVRFMVIYGDVDRVC